MSNTPQETPDNATNRPLVDSAVVGLDHARGITITVSAALKQDYANLKIIISSDYSTERTIEYARPTVERYIAAIRRPIRGTV